MDPGDGCDTMLALGLGFHQHYDQIRVHKSPVSPVEDQKGGDDDHLQLPSLTLGLVETAACESASDIFHTADQGDLQGDLEKRPLLMISDEDEDCCTPRKKLRLSKEQISILETSFMSHSTLNPKQKEDLAREMSLRPRQVEVWFQNRRARIKLKQTEVDCEFLRRRCEALREENRKLQEELHELKSQASQPTAITTPTLMQIPQTALPVMCPSCERITNKPAAEGRFFSRNFRMDQQLAS